MKQEGLIDCVIETLGLDIDTVNGKAIPAEARPLHMDTDIIFLVIQDQTLHMLLTVLHIICSSKTFS